jgi:hypothetical protein
MCPEKGILSAYVDAELPDPWRARLEHHLEGCAACSAHVHAFRSLHERLLADADPLSQDAMVRVRAALTPRPARTRLRWGNVTVPVPLALAAASLMLLLGVALVYSLFRPSAGITPFTASRMELEADVEDITRLLDLLNRGSERTVVLDVPRELKLSAFGDPVFRPILQRVAE